MAFIRSWQEGSNALLKFGRLVKLSESDLIQTTRFLHAAALQNRFDQLGDLPEDVDDCWNSVSSTIRDTAGEVIGTRKKIRKPWLSADTFAIILKRKPVPMHIKITLRGSDFKGSSKQKPRPIVRLP